MTYYDALKEKFPNLSDEVIDIRGFGGTISCPGMFFEDMPTKTDCGTDRSVETCKACWCKEVPDTPSTSKPADDPVNHPSHYTNGGMECIDEMVLIFGKEAAAHFCLCNAWKYRRRALYKNGEQDMQKSHWYINKYKELTENA